MMAFAAKTPTVLRFEFGGIWGAPEAVDGPFRLPQALWPHVTPSHAVYAQGAPTEGHWRVGQVVWRALDGIPDGNETITVPQYDPFQKFVPPAPGAPLGWVCTLGGQPGSWSNVSSPIIGTAVAQPSSSGETRRELAELRAQVSELREAVQALAARKTDDVQPSWPRPRYHVRPSARQRVS